MQIKSIILENFRGYHNRQIIEFDNFTAFVGKNDIGKSSVLEALDIFFNDNSGPIKIDREDINMTAYNEANGSNVDIVIGVIFKDIPTDVILDEQNTTSLTTEYLLDADQNLTVLKRYSNGSKSKVFIYANHPSQSDCYDLLSKKQSDLRKLTKDIECDHNKNAEMREAIRNQHINELNLQMQEIDVSKEDAKNIWEKLKNYMPIYCLFQSDRSNGDKDKEVQDPLKEAVKVIMHTENIKQKCNDIYDAVLQELQVVSNRTLQKITEMNPNLAATLNPTMPSMDDLKWTDVFKNVSITGDNDIPINKRGSGVKRLVLINFFRAEAERRQQDTNSPGVIFAIEEPETAQHTDHQILLTKSLISLSEAPNTQVVITTHSTNVLKLLSFNNIRLVKDDITGKVIEHIQPSHLPYPSLNEIAYTSFGEITEEYHNELYGHLEYKNWLQDYRSSKKMYPYIQQLRDGSTHSKPLVLTDIIRHQIHHPENHNNNRYTRENLKDSINDMRLYIKNKNMLVP